MIIITSYQTRLERFISLDLLDLLANSELIIKKIDERGCVVSMNKPHYEKKMITVVIFVL